MRRKAVLLLALVAAVGFGFGWITEDLCCLGGSYADDPNAPIVASECALLAHPQTAQKAALPTVTLGAVVSDHFRVKLIPLVPADQPSGLPSLENPRRC